MASTTLIEESYSTDSSYYTYNKSTNRISSSEQQLYKLNNINKEYDGVNSIIREILELDGLNTAINMLAH
jgi:hypothetical protein